MRLPHLPVLAFLLLTACGEGSSPSTTPAPTPPSAAPAPPPPPAARVFACVTDISSQQNENERYVLRTYRGGALVARTLPPSLFTPESLDGGTPTWNSVFWYSVDWHPTRAATRFGAVKDGKRLFRGFDLQPVLRDPSGLQVVLRPAGGGVSRFPIRVGEPGEPYLLSNTAYSLLASRADESWSMALTDDGQDVNTVFDDPACGPPGTSPG